MFDAQARAQAAEGKFPPFAFRGLDGKSYTLPHFMMVSQSVAAMAAAGQMYESMEAAADEAAWKAISAMPLHLAAELGEAWVGMEDAGKESSPSSPQANGVKRSPRTSRSVGSPSKRSPSTRSPRRPAS